MTVIDRKVGVFRWTARAKLNTLSPIWTFIV